MRLTIGKQLTLGFGVIIALILISAIVAYFAVDNMKQNVSRVVEEAFPALVYCDDLTSGLNQSLASLRGYIILGADEEQANRFKSERRLAWAEINAAVKRLDELSHVWTDPDDQDDLRRIQNKVTELDGVQHSVENNAHAADNIAALHLLQTEVAPKANAMQKALQAIVSEESALEATLHRKQFLDIMTGTNSELAMLLASAHGYVISGTPELSDEVDKRSQSYRDAYRLSVSVLHRMTDSQRTRWNEFDNLHAEFETLSEQVIQLRNADDWNKAHYELQNGAIPLSEQIADAADNLKRSANSRVKRDQTRLTRASTTLTTTLMVATLLAIAIGVIWALLMSRGLITTIKQAVNTVATTAAQMSDSTDQQQEMAQQQAAAVNEVTTTMEQLTRSAESSAQQAEQSLNQTKHVLELADNGTQIVRQTSDGMSNLKASVNDVANQIAQLSDQNNQINDITALVRDLAKRTNVLALNASVEAAQAGEQGAGFAVVAGEIRRLAEESAGSAIRIQNLVEQVQASTNSTVMATEEGTKTLKTGSELASKTSNAFQQVTDSIAGAVEGIQQISLNAKEQAHSISHVGAAMDELNRGAQETERQAMGSKQRIDQLQKTVSQLQAIVKGKN